MLKVLCYTGGARFDYLEALRIANSIPPTSDLINLLSHTSGVDYTRIDALRTEVTSKNTLSPKRKAPDPQPPLAEVYGDT